MPNTAKHSDVYVRYNRCFKLTLLTTPQLTHNLRLSTAHRLPYTSLTHEALYYIRGTPSIATRLVTTNSKIGLGKIGLGWPAR